QIRIHEAGTKTRLIALVVLEELQGRCEVCRGLSKGGTADLNDILHFELLPERDYVVRVGNPVQFQKTFRTSKAKEMLVDVEVPAKLSKDQVDEVEKAAKAFFEADAEKRAQWKFDDKLQRLLIDNEEAVREAVWNAYRDAGIHAESKKDSDANQV